MAAIITVQGTVEDILAFAETLRKGQEMARSEQETKLKALSSDERTALRSGNLIMAIKFYRERSGSTLKESKDFIESTEEGKICLDWSLRGRNPEELPLF